VIRRIGDHFVVRSSFGSLVPRCELSLLVLGSLSSLERRTAGSTASTQRSAPKFYGNLTTAGSAAQPADQFIGQPI
jgi:hypothetical protein